MNLGLYGKETEPGNKELIQSLSAISNSLENFSEQKTLKTLLENLWNSASDASTYDEVSMQLFYANQIYWNFDETIEAIQNGLDDKNIDLSQWLDCYTWLGTDRDGRPYDTNEKTEKLIKIFEIEIRKNYTEELILIFDACSIKDELNVIINRLSTDNENSYHLPIQFCNDLKNLSNKAINVDGIILKIKTFGFHYMKLEFRDNSKMLSEVIDTLTDNFLIYTAIGVNEKYCTLNRAEKISFLTQVLHEDNNHLISEIRTDYLKRNKISYEKKLILYRNKDYIELMDIDPEYIKQVNVDSALGRFDLMTKYPERIHVHAIAETTGPEDALALLFLAKIASGFTDYIDVALQPEDSNGAVNVLEMIRTLYENPIYRKHLKTRGDKQYIVFGPSDTGKQGGKAMHVANMNIANAHQIISSEFKIKPVIHVIVGYEHARCNGALEEILDGYGTLNQDESQYMMAGLNEMRSHLLSSKQVVGFLSNLYFSHENHNCITDLQVEKISAKIKGWLEIVKRYQDFFHNHSSLPDLLRLVARFDIINSTAKGTRPPTRILNAKTLEDRPDAIRAIPWTRSFLLAGIHSEIIGAGYLASIPAEKLHQMYLNEKDFQRYVHHVAYGAARSDMNFAWSTAGENRPCELEIYWLAIEFQSSLEPLSARHMLAWIDYEITLAACFVYKSLHGVIPKKAVNKMELLKIINPALFHEVFWRDSLFSFHKIFLIESSRNQRILKEKHIQDLFSGALTISNTSLSVIYPENANTLNWDVIAS